MEGSGSTWRVLGSSVTGTSHLRIGRGCDDAHLYRIVGNNTLLLAVADGAGSASHSARGAAVAVQAAIDAAEAALTEQGEPQQTEEWQPVLQGILEGVHMAIRNLLQLEQAARKQVEQKEGSTPDALDTHNRQSELFLRDFATTLLVAIVTQGCIAVAQIGDGIAVAHFDDGSVTSLYARQSQRYINETDFITDPAFLSHAAYIIVPRENLRGIALLTDGLQLLATTYPENVAHPPFFLPLFKFAASPDAAEEELRQFLTSERVNNRTDDDKTLLLAVLI